MKRTLALLTALLMCFSLCACHKQDDSAKAAFENLNAAADLIDQFAYDMRQVWNAAINHPGSIADGGCTYLSEITYLSSDELCNGAAMLIAKSNGSTDHEAYFYHSYHLFSMSNAHSDVHYSALGYTLFDACIQTVINGYDISGKTGQIRASLNSAANYLNEIDDVDYPHWNDLKGYYESCSALFEFCKDPLCTFDQFDSIRNEHINAIRQYKASLSALL